MFSQLIITFLGWLALIIIGINLIGMLVRGLVLVSDVENQLSVADDSIKKGLSEIYDPKMERRVNIIAVVLILIYLGVLAYFWNIWVVVAAAMIMVSRIPDLLWEIKHGRHKIKDMPPIYILTLLVNFAAFPVLWYALYRI